VLHASLVLFSLGSPELYCVSGTEHKATGFVFLYTSLLSLSTYAQISLPALYSRTPSDNVLVSVWETKFRTHTKQQAETLLENINYKNTR
jgi:hypothetical protein